MSTITSDVQVAPQGMLTSSTTLEVPLGAKVVGGDGSEYRYAKVGATALVAGTLLQAPVEVTNHQGLTPAAAAIGATSVTVTLGATAATANQYAGGWLVGTITPGQGLRYKIASHPAADASATLALALVDPLTVALTSSSRVDLVLNPYSGVIINPTTATSAAVGAAITTTAAASFCWIQTKGACVLLSDGGSTVGTNVSASNATAGAVEAAVTAQGSVGIALTGVATTDYGMFLLNLP